MKSKDRVRDIGEVFTAKREIDGMLDLVGSDIDNPKKRILEPACGNGNFLVEILIRRLNWLNSRKYKKKADYERNVLIALSTIYGIDIMPDNIDECRDRLYHEVLNLYDLTRNTENPSESFLLNVKQILTTNIILGDSLNGKKDINFIEYVIKANNRVERYQYNLAELEKGNNEPLEAFQESNLQDMPVIHALTPDYFKGDQIEIFSMVEVVV